MRFYSEQDEKCTGLAFQA